MSLAGQCNTVKCGKLLNKAIPLISTLVFNAFYLSYPYLIAKLYPVEVVYIWCPVMLRNLGIFFKWPRLIYICPAKRLLLVMCWTLLRREQHSFCKTCCRSFAINTTFQQKICRVNGIQITSGGNPNTSIAIGNFIVLEVIVAKKTLHRVQIIYQVKPLCKYFSPRAFAMRKC